MANPTFGAGNLQWLGFGAESVAYGTAAAAPLFWLPTKGAPIWTHPTAKLLDDGLRGSMGSEFQQINGMRYDQIAVKSNVYLDSIFPLIRHMLGYPDVVSGAADPWTHKTSLQNGSNGQPISNTIFWYDAQGKALQMTGAQVSSLKITLKTDGLAEVDITWVGLPGTFITPPTNTPTTAKPMPSWNTVITVGGVALTKYSEINYDISRQTEAVPTLNGTQAPFAIFAGEVAVTIGLVGVYQGFADNDLAAEIANGQPVITTRIAPAGDVVHALTIQTSAVAYTMADPSGDQKWMEIKGSAKALTNPTDVAGGGNQSPMLVTLLSPVSTAIV